MILKETRRKGNYFELDEQHIGMWGLQLKQNLGENL